MIGHNIRLVGHTNDNKKKEKLEGKTRKNK